MGTFSSTSRHTNWKRRVLRQRVAPADFRCKLSNDVLFCYRLLAATPRMPSFILHCTTRKARLDPCPLVKKGKVRCVIYAVSHRRAPVAAFFRAQPNSTHITSLNDLCSRYLLPSCQGLSGIMIALDPLVGILILSASSY